MSNCGWQRPNVQSSALDLIPFPERAAIPELGNCDIRPVELESRQIAGLDDALRDRAPLSSRITRPVSS